MFANLFHRLAARCAKLSIVFALGLAFSLTGCNTFDPSQWTQEQVAKEITEQWDLSSVDLQPSNGGYTGKGKNAEGETFNITVKLDPATKSATYQGKGDRGTDLDYSVRAETAR